MLHSSLTVSLVLIFCSLQVIFVHFMLLWKHLLLNSIADMTTNFEDMCKYVGLPSDLSLIFSSSSDETAPQLISSIAQK